MKFKRVLSINSPDTPVSLIKSQKGQGLIEYLIIVCLVSVASIAVMRVIGQNINAKFSQVANSIQGKKSTAGGVHMDEIRETHYKKRDLSNFFSGAASRGSGDANE